MKFNLVDTNTFGITSSKPFFQSPETEHIIEFDPSSYVHGQFISLDYYPPEFCVEVDPPLALPDTHVTVQCGQPVATESCEEEENDEDEIVMPCEQMTPRETLMKFKEKFSGTPIEHIYSKVLPSISTELKYNTWTLFSVKELVKRCDLYKDRFYDIGIQYAGMGYIIVLCYSPTKQMFFFHVDGGSNGYDRQDYYEKYLSASYDPKNFPCIELIVSATRKNDMLFPYSKLETCLEENTCYV